MSEHTPEDSAQAPLIDIVLPVEESEHVSAWKTAIAEQLGLPEERIVDMRLRKHSIDARQRQIKVQLRIEVGLDQPLPAEPELKPLYDRPTADAKTVLIIGCGPAGMFAALRALELGLKPIILERGKDASARRFDLGPILKKGTVIEDSNYCFGEGGAGTFSDGKLYTRVKKRGPIRDIYETLVAHGAPERILIDAHPHIGSNLLPKVVMAMRQSILEAGGEVHFGTKVNQFILKDRLHSRGKHSRWPRVPQRPYDLGNWPLRPRHLPAASCPKCAPRTKALCGRCTHRAPATSD